MEVRNYTPLGDHKLVKSILERARKEVLALAERYAAMINDALADKPSPG